jgi:hypothetical protein
MVRPPAAVACDHRLIHRGAALDDLTVNRELLTRADDHNVAGGDLTDRYLQLAVATDHPGCGG